MKFFEKFSSKKANVEKLKNEYSKENNKEDEKIKLDLSLPPKDEIKTSKVVRDVYKEEMEEMAEINEGDLNITTSYVFKSHDSYEASIYVRNATKFNINLENPCFIVVDENGKIILQSIFNGEDLGTIPPFSARPWKVDFDNTYVPESVNLAKCKVNFKAVKPFAEKGEVSVGFKILEGLSDEKASSIIDYNFRLPLLKENEVNFNLESTEIKDGKLCFNVIIRNSTNSTLVNSETLKPIIESLPVSIYKDNKKVHSEAVKFTSIVGAKQARYVSFTTKYETSSTEGITVKLNEN